MALAGIILLHVLLSFCCRFVGHFAVAFVAFVSFLIFMRNNSFEIFLNEIFLT